MRKKRISCAYRDSSNAETNAEIPTSVVVIWRREETRWVCHSVRRTQTFEPTLSAFHLAAKRRVECARVNLYSLFVSVLTAVFVVYEYVSRERYAPSALRLVFRPEPAPADCTLSPERRAARRSRVGRAATELYSCVTTQVIDRSAAASCREKLLEFRDHQSEARDRTA